MIFCFLLGSRLNDGLLSPLFPPTVPSLFNTFSLFYNYYYYCYYCIEFESKSTEYFLFLVLFLKVGDINLIYSSFVNVNYFFNYLILPYAAKCLPKVISLYVGFLLFLSFILYIFKVFLVVWGRTSCSLSILKLKYYCLIRFETVLGF